MTINEEKELATKYRIAIRQVHEFGKQLQEAGYATLFHTKEGDVCSEYSEEVSNIKIWKVEKKEI